MTRKDAINKWVIPAIKNTWNEKKCSEIIKALSAEPCEDCISRQAVIDEMDKRHKEEDCITKGFVNNLPLVTPKPKIGHWIKNSQYSNDYCSECHYELLMIRQTKYCPNCGADMRGDKSAD